MVIKIRSSVVIVLALALAGCASTARQKERQSREQKLEADMAVAEARFAKLPIEEQRRIESREPLALALARGEPLAARTDTQAELFYGKPDDVVALTVNGERVTRWGYQINMAEYLWIEFASGVRTRYWQHRFRNVEDLPH